ncbi:uncharacterized protein LOC109856169 [Pseudomyrmex gracilis]|uniref:uncharacterized protein LOC109856169 n=1 Tax=Pseudomyrmex gracilis TaxID=219809 RepID=UPI0009955E45|nr:uncharacterized protein LOC109856169 [Pseudomyrmex gracilis]XP_020286738.1 uncharacterized protein LOC109856169 [Pseudomyrmex gracilis]
MQYLNMYIIEDQLRDETRTVDTQSLLDSVIAKNKTIITRLPIPMYNKFIQYWRIDPEMSRRWESLFLPVGSIFILGVVVLLMVLFKRCPHTVAAIVAVILTIIIALTTVIALNNHEPIYT